MSKERDLPEFTPVTRVEVRRADIAELVSKDDLLRTAPIVRAMGEAAREVIKRGIGRRYPDKVPVYRSGDSGDSLYLVLKGEARLFGKSGSEIVEVGAAVKGDVFGEEEVLNATNSREVSVIAAGELDIVELPRQALVDCARERPEVVKCLKDLMEKRRAARDEIAAFLNRW